MFKTLFVFALASTAWAQFTNQPPASWDRPLDLEIAAPRFKGTGEVWDFNPGSSPMGSFANFAGMATDVAPVNPDMVLIILDEHGTYTRFIIRPEDRRPASPNPVRRIIAPAETSSDSRCPDRSICQYRDLRVPNDLFAAVIIDQDKSAHDFMQAAILYEPGLVTSSRLEQMARATHKYLADLAAQRTLEGGPAPNSKIPTQPLPTCQGKFCFGDDQAGLPGVKILTARADFTPGVLCDGPTPKGHVETFITGDREVEIQATLDFTCSGDASYVWDLGDGNIVETKKPTVTHRYSAAKAWDVTVTPRCYQQPYPCQTKEIPFRIDLTK